MRMNRIRTRRPAGLLQKKGRWGYLFIMPFLIGFVFLFANSLYSTIRFAFSTVTPGMNDVTTTFVGWENFRRAFLVDEKFPQLLVSSIVSMLTDVPVLLVFSFFCAVLLHQKFRGNGLVKSIFFLTVILSSGVFQQMTVDTAAANQFGLTGEMETGGMQMLQSMQLERYLTDIGISEGLIEFIVGPIDRLFVVMSSSGIQIFVFLAGLGAIPPSLYESCSVEGASGWETFWKITFPMVSPLILVNTVYTVIDSFMASNNELLTFIYGQGFSDMQFGYASALCGFISWWLQCSWRLSPRCFPAACSITPESAHYSEGRRIYDERHLPFAAAGRRAAAAAEKPVEDPVVEAAAGIFPHRLLLCDPVSGADDAVQGVHEPGGSVRQVGAAAAALVHAR